MHGCSLNAQIGSSRPAPIQRVVITGGSGFLGSHIVRLLAERFTDRCVAALGIAPLGKAECHHAFHRLDLVVLDAAAKPNPDWPQVTIIRGDLRVRNITCMLQCDWYHLPVVEL